MANIAKTLKNQRFFKVFGTSASFDCCVVGIICWLIFNWMLIYFGVENQWKMYQKSSKIYAKMCSKSGWFWLRFWSRFLIDFWLIFDSKIDPKSIKKSIKKWCHFRTHFGSILARFWVPKWFQNRPKEAQRKSTSPPRWAKLIFSYRRALRTPPGTPKWSQNGAKMEPKWTQIGAKMEPKWSQNRPQRLQRPNIPPDTQKVTQINKIIKNASKIQQKIKENQ